MMRRPRASLLIPLLVSALASTARADVSAAARAFTDGQSAQLDGDYDHAAQSFELAFSNSPSKEALRSAVRARQLAGQLARAATLAELLLAKYADDPPSAKLASDVIAEARPKLERLTVACGARCVLAVGGRAMSLPAADTHVIYLAVGRQTIEATYDDGRSATRDVTAVAGADPVVQIVPPPSVRAAPSNTEATPGASTERTASRGLPPIVSVIGGVVTAGLAGATIWSGLDTRKAHDDYAAHPTHEKYTAGRSKQLRTNILFGSAVGVGLVTAAVAVWWTHWGSGEAPAVSFAPAPGGAFATYGARF